MPKARSTKRFFHLHRAGSVVCLDSGPSQHQPAAMDLHDLISHIKKEERIRGGNHQRQEFRV